MDAEGGPVMETTIEPKSPAAMVNIAQIRKFLGQRRAIQGAGRACAINEIAPDTA